MTKVEELALLAQCALADNRQAFGKLVEAYQPRVRRFLLNLTAGDESLTDDIAQETFLKAYVSIRGFRGMSSFSTWLYRIAYNEFVTIRRREHPALPIDPERTPEPMVDTAAGTEAAVTLRQALATLSDIERTVVTLFYIDDLPVKRVAQITALPEGTVKSHLHRCKAKLAKAVKS